MWVLIFIVIIATIVIMSNKNKALRRQNEELRKSVVKDADIVLEDYASTKSDKTELGDSVLKVSEVNDTGIRSGNFKSHNIIKRLIGWIVHDWVIKIGGLMVMIAVVWFVSYAFTNDWVGEVGRVALGLIFGLSLLFWGMLRTSASHVQGNILMLVGVITMLASLLSATILYEIFPVFITLIIMLSVVFFVVLQAVQQRNITLGITMFVLGNILPMYMIDKMNSVSILLAYLFVLTVGTLWVSWQIPGRILNIIAIISTIIYVVVLGEIGWFDDSSIDIVFSVSMLALFYAASIITIVRVKKADIRDVAVVGMIGVTFWLLMNLSISNEVLPIVFIVGALVSASGAFLLRNVMQVKSVAVVVMYSFVAFSLLVMATSLKLEANSLIVALTIELGALISVILYFFKKQKIDLIWRFIGILYLLPINWLLVVIQELFRAIDIKNAQQQVGQSIIIDNESYTVIREVTLVSVSPELFTLLIVGCVGGIIAWVAMHNIKKADNEEHRINFVAIARIFWLIFGFCMILLVWIGAHIVIDNFNVATAVSLIIYTLVGVKFYVNGINNHYLPYRIVGGILLVIVVGRLFLIEFWEMSIIVRIITFFVVGVLFISASFFVKSRNNNI